MASGQRTAYFSLGSRSLTGTAQVIVCGGVCFLCRPATAWSDADQAVEHNHQLGLDTDPNIDTGRDTSQSGDDGYYCVPSIGFHLATGGGSELTCNLDIYNVIRGRVELMGQDVWWKSRYFGKGGMLIFGVVGDEQFPLHLNWQIVVIIIYRVHLIYSLVTFD